MVRIRSRGENVRRFILENVGNHSEDISRVAAERFRITRQAVNKHLQKLVEEGALAEEGKTRNRSYKLAAMTEWNQTYTIASDLAEDVVWRNDIAPVLGQQPENVLDIWQYGFTEMFNNAISHSEGTYIHVNAVKTAINSEIGVADNGVGIFKKIQAAMNLLDERHAILELAKGKLTTDPTSHTGEGIFFTSRMFDSFQILSEGVFFSHAFEAPEDWILEQEREARGTYVFMKLSNHTARTAAKIFHQYTSGEDFGFTKTVVPVMLAQYGNDKLISRSQAKRVLARVELFKTVMLDFKGVPSIGQAFADEIFRVFRLQHPDIQLLATNTNSEVKRMIARAQSTATPAE
jgi:anti-sigma regulatory factor (Ser/Thr protein kinase)/biotin operon repressor